jgi:hypothetical protein
MPDAPDASRVRPAAWATAVYVVASAAFLVLVFAFGDSILTLVLLAIDALVLARLSPFIFPPFDGRFRHKARP